MIRAGARRFLNLSLLGLISTIMSPHASFGQKVRVGETAPDFLVPTLDGQRAVRLSDLHGRRVLIFQWASW